MNLTEVPFGTYKVLYGDETVEEGMYLGQGGVYTFVMQKDKDGKWQSELFTVTDANSVSILWLIPQYVIMTLGEVMFSVTGLEFSYSQAPVSMKSVIQACFQLTVAFGNVIDIIIVEANIFDSQANEFFLFAGLMFVDMFIFAILAYRYKPNNPNKALEDSTSRPGTPKPESKPTTPKLQNKSDETEESKAKQN
uniref:Peptide transporter family 1 n=1 Tax=Megaselia scalaris TaxID=36166 RepID=T1H3R5_MEGSC